MSAKRIHRLEVENYRGISFADVTLAPAVVQIVGKNGHGKSTLLHAIAAAVEKRLAYCAEPIRQGWDRATIKVSVGSAEIETVIVRTFEKDDRGKAVPKIRIQTPEGYPLKDPGKFIASLISDGVRDPLKFMEADDKDRLLELRRFVEGVDFEAIGRQQTIVFETRTGVNRDLARVTNERDALKRDVDRAPPAGRPIEAINAEMRAHSQTAAAHAAWKHEDLEHDSRISTADRRVSDTEARVESARLQLQAEEAALSRHRAVLASVRGEIRHTEPPLPGDISELQAELEAASAQAAYAAKREQLSSKETERDNLSKKTSSLSAELERMSSAVRDAIAASDMPVDGLTITEDAVLLDGVPYEQANTARRLQASVGVVMASVPEDGLRVLWLQDGPLLDDTSMALVADLAAKNDFQVIVERITASADVGDAIVIENGTVQGGPKRTAKAKPPSESTTFQM